VPETTLVARNGDRCDVGAQPFDEAARDQFEALLAFEPPGLRPRRQLEDVGCRREPALGVPHPA
jgi:hypothetical protein